MASLDTVNQSDFIPKLDSIRVDYAKIKSAAEKARKDRKWLLAFVVGTKPCFYKFYGAIQAAESNGYPYIVINANQHYDSSLTQGIKEFGLDGKISVDLHIGGDLGRKTGELYFKCIWLARKLRQLYPDVETVPVVLGDTILAGVIPSAWLFAVGNKGINLEAGLRSMSPAGMRQLGKTSPQDFVMQQREAEWEVLRNEPFPEQWDTFVSSAACQFQFAPLDLNRQHLLREGYKDEDIFVHGNPVVDAIQLKLGKKPEQSVFEIYPQLEKGEWIRVDIHRRENLTARRLKSIVGAVRQLVKEGRKVVFIQMGATREAFANYGMQDAFSDIMKKDNFLFTDLWPMFEHVVEFYSSEHNLAALTDSGGVQEDMNMMKKLCMTCRFSTDRPETVRQSGGNFLAPPYSAEFMAEAVKAILENDDFRKKARGQKPLYGKDFGTKFIGTMNKIGIGANKPFKWSHETLGLWKDEAGSLKYL
ncbi:MAG: UDP-N-acetylglucosamine 2-epimerase [archaeon GW2011_AR3]|nr:MAG: UDP-N-acetylglucosamine 2-epimerase [archaeon GW2011_AR3]MBS3109607.1 UDP-N-acetylglucosamine 2-epimerase [Candidatus Woesearchaeota archaeon]